MEANLENALDWDVGVDEGEEALIVEPAKRRVFTESADPTVKVLYDDYKSGYLILQPNFQRYFVWDQSKSSRLIESVLMNVPLPVVYLAQEEDGTASVIDGQQRLTSFFQFIDGQFALKNLRVLSELNGRRFANLDRTQQRVIQQCAIRSIKILRESDPELRFEIFERLNTGSVALNDQELRNCVYRGPYNELLKEMSCDHDFMYILGIMEPERRMRDVELVLRFSAFYHSTYLKYQSPMRRFLNRDMESNRLIELR